MKVSLQEPALQKPDSCLDEGNDQFYRHIVQQAELPILVFKGEEMILAIANDPLLKIYQVGREAIGKPLLEILPEQKGQGFMQLLLDVYLNGVTHHGHESLVYFIRADGKREDVYLNFTYQPYREPSGVITGVLVLATDVTKGVLARRKIEELAGELREIVVKSTFELGQVNIRLEKSNAALEQFAYAASHDMQEPLRKVQTFNGFLLQKYSECLDEKGRVYLQKINSSVSRMKSIIDDLLAYSHYSREDQIFDLTDLNIVLKNVEVDLELSIQQKSATLIKKDLPTIRAVPAQMNQLFYNLISNALKFTKYDAPVQISISAKELSAEEAIQRGSFHPDHPYIDIIVQDNGIGFKQEQAEQIFSLFKRLHSKTKYEGTGIGLGLCKKIVQNHGGDIYALSTPGEGAAFHVILPLD